MFFSLIGVVAIVSGCHGYSLGPPLGACQEMFPTDHGYPAQTSDPPFSFTLSTNQYDPGDTISGEDVFCC